MSHTTSLRRTASALGATALLGTVLAAPAMARPDPGTDGSYVDSTTAASQFPTGLHRSQREGDTSGPDRDAQLGGFTQPGERSMLPQNQAPRQSAPIVVFRDNDAVEYLQVGAGVLAGIALAGAGAAVISRRNHRGLTPA
jgi:hypothetical protein